MKLRERIQSTTFKITLFYFIVAFLAYFPFTSMLFALKNDAFTGYFPPKFFMSESLKDGFLPLWNPYINYGIPQYGDMSSGFWSPITWLIASTIGYNAYTFTIEEAIYIFLAGVGMFKLTGYWALSTNTRLISGMAYMCSGYFVGHLQHFNWISGAAFLPFCILYYINLFRKFDYISVLKLGIAFCLFISSAHPGIIIGSIYFFILLSLGLFWNSAATRHTKPEIFKKIILKNIVAFFTILITCIGTCVGYWEVLQYISRGDKISLSDSLSNFTTLQSWVSLLLPFSTTKNTAWFATDISMRNCYFGIFYFFIFSYGIINKKTNWQKLLLLLAVPFFLFSLGNIFKEFSYRFIPLIGFVRLNGEFRIFIILCFIIFSAIELDKIKRHENRPRLKILLRLLIAILFIIIAFAIYNMVTSQQSIFYNLDKKFSLERSYLKLLVDHISFYDTLAFQGIIQLIFLCLFYSSLQKRKYTLLLLLFFAEFSIATFMNLPYTGVGKASVKKIQAFFEKSPPGIITPDLIPTVQHPNISLEHKKMIGDWSLYSKQVGVTAWVPYPITLKNTFNFFKTENLHEINSKPFVYFMNTVDNANIKINSFTPSCLSLYAFTNRNESLIVKQNFYPFWQCTVNNSPVPVSIEAETLMKIPLTNRENNIRFIFSNKKITYLLIFQLMFFIISMFIVVRTSIKKQL